MQALGPVMLDVEGTSLTDEERRRLAHPLTGGVILFSRNFADTAQLAELTREIHALRTPHLLVAVDHEGGRVQRFREGFTRLPPMRLLGELWDVQRPRAKHMARQIGWVMAAELRACGVDFSFAPVLDVDHGVSEVIGNRAFHRDPQVVAELAHQFMLGLRQGGMVAVGKHFPGHGFVAADSHTDAPVDTRELAEIRLTDLVPFQQMVDFGLAAVMPAHVVYARVDDKPAGFSKVWLKEVLRHELGFDGVIFSDDLCMAGAHAAGGIVARARTALEAGCDMVLVCNRPDLADELLHGLDWRMSAVSLARLARMHGRPHAESLARLREDAHYVDAVHAIGRMGHAPPELPLEPVGEPDVRRG
jgi:beta-N-acetylhexosaminidase